MKALICDEFGNGFQGSIKFDIKPEVGEYIEFNLGEGYNYYKIMNILYADVDGKTVMTIQLNSSDTFQYQRSINQ